MSLRAGHQDGREGARGASGPGGRVGAGPFLIDVWGQCQLLQEASRGLTDQRVGTAQSFWYFLKTFLFQPAPTLPTSTVHTEPPPHSLPPAWRFRRVCFLRRLCGCSETRWAWFGRLGGLCWRLAELAGSGLAQPEPAGGWSPAVAAAMHAWAAPVSRCSVHPPPHAAQARVVAGSPFSHGH